MKNVMKILKSQKMFSNKFNIVKLCEENGIYSVEYKYASMNEYSVYKTENLIIATYDFLKIALFILS